MSSSLNTAIVGFHDFYPVASTSEADIGKLLATVIGFKRVVKKYKLSNSVLVEVEESLLVTFLSQVSSIEEVEYGEANPTIAPSNYHDQVSSAYIDSNPKLDSIRQLHNLSPAFDDGLGITVAVIDSGVSPHPYLPATSYKESLSLSEYWHPSIRHSVTASKELKRLAIVEDQNDPYRKTAIALDIASHIKVCNMRRDRFVKLIWEDWLPGVDTWRSNYAASVMAAPGSATKRPNLPSLPLRSSFLGAMRRISSESFNFVDKNLNVEDKSGHGTQVAGILVGRACTSFKVSDPLLRSHIEKLEIDVLGITPNAELMVLKCYEEKQIEMSNVDKMIEALEHAHENEVDIIYIGLSINPRYPDPSLAVRATTLNRTIKAVAKSQIPVVCPAGNLHREGLMYPAACEDAIAVTAAVLDNSNFPFDFASGYSNFADRNKREKVAFIAFGGDETFGVRTTDRNFGFTSQCGTSTAAAIVTGILAKYLASNKISNQLRNFSRVLVSNNFSSASTLIDPSFKVSAASTLSDQAIRMQDPMNILSAKVTLKELFTAASTNILHRPGLPVSQQGTGLLREF